MQIIYKNEDKRDSSRRTNSVGAIIYTGKISRYLEEIHFGRFGNRQFRIQDIWGIFSRHKERVWRKRKRTRRNNESSRAEESRVRK